MHCFKPVYCHPQAVLSLLDGLSVVTISISNSQLLNKCHIACLHAHAFCQHNSLCSTFNAVRTPLSINSPSLGVAKVMPRWLDEALVLIQPVEQRLRPA